VDEKRFFSEKEESGGLRRPGTVVIVDSTTGVQYLFVYWGNAAGLALLVDREGKPLLSDDPRVLE